MALTQFYSFETQDLASNADAEGGVTTTGTVAISTAQARTGVASVRCNPASGASGSIGNAGFSSRWVHFGLYIATLPSLARVIAGTAAANAPNLVLNSTGTLSPRNNTTVLGTSAALSTNRWYWIGWLNTANANAVLLQVDGVDQVSGTNGSANATATLGCTGTEASAIDIYFDDAIFDDAGFLNPSRVALLKPISDNAVGAGWTLGTGTAISGNSGSTAVKNTPPLGVADLAVGSDVKQIRNAGANTDAYAANLTTYRTAGLVESDAVLAVLPILMTSVASATTPKSGSYTIANPTKTKTAFSVTTFGTAVAGTYITNWVKKPVGGVAFTAKILSPSIALDTSPVLTVTQDTSSTFVAMVCFMGMLVVWTPGHAAIPLRSAQQAVKRAGSY